MRDYIFGLKSVVANDQNGRDFEAVEGKQANPYSNAFFNDPNNMTWDNIQARITSIPSPYARMHITDLAFKESNCGMGTASAAVRAKINLSSDYKRAMSHCLDVFELLYHADEYNLPQLGITLHKLDLISTHTTDEAEREILYDDNGKLTELGRYIQTLDLYRDAYVETIKNATSKDVHYNFDFKSLYVLKYKGRVFAATSPFTGFFAKADCDLDDANITISGRKILSSDPLTWRTLKQRDFEFQEFLYLLLKDKGLRNIYKNLYKSLEDSLANNLTNLQKDRFDNHDEYLKFDLGNGGLQSLPGHNDVYIRPDGLDCSYLKYLLYIQTPVDLTIDKEEYKTPIAQRKFNNNLLKWIGVNDILSDALFILPYDVNDNYNVISYNDRSRDNREYRRCLIPVKSEVLEYFKLEDLVNNISITRLKNGNTYSVALKMRLDNGNIITLRREYSVGNAGFPNGTVIRGDEMKPFAFGIYPFVKSPSAQNIYKVLFYNVFESPCSLKFYHRNADGKAEEVLASNHSYNKTNDISINKDDAPINCEYHHVENDVEFVELSVAQANGANYTSLIIPKLREVHQLDYGVHVAIDVGTSNTCIAYNVNIPGQGFNIEEINTHHKTGETEWNELTFMNCRCKDSDMPGGPLASDCNKDDLVVKQNDDPNTKASAEMLDHQLCEFIPSRIDPTSDKNYKFPIPSVINSLRVEMGRTANIDKIDANPLVNFAIPFAYYERGKRHYSTDAYSDLILGGQELKWFTKYNPQTGNYETDDIHKKAFDAFVKELLFIVRCHILSKGYNLSNVSIYWSYPLSFDQTLVAEYDTIWKNSYKKFICNTNDVGKYVHYTNESRSPIHHCIDPTTAQHLTLLVDMGGGSTDVIGYKNYNPLFITSYRFAGNALYVNDESNMIRRDQNLFEKYILNCRLFSGVGGDDGNHFRVQKISAGENESISSLMNYGFSKAPDEFTSIFRNADPKFMLLLHNSALIYHIAQLCKAKSEDMPVDIYFTGNGSNQFKMNADYKDLIKIIFESVYGKNGNINITFKEDPKSATVRGTLKGVYEKKLELDENSKSDSVIMVGDATQVMRRENWGGTECGNDVLDSVHENILAFVDMFYEKIYTIPQKRVSKEVFIEVVEFCRSSVKINNGIIYDSLFFVYIKRIMDRLSVLLVNK